MHRAATIPVFLLALSATPVPAQDVFELPLELTPPQAPLVFELDNASIDVVLDAEAPAVLRARSMSKAGSEGAALAAFSDAGKIVVRRAGDAGDAGTPAAAEPGPRLRLELVIDPEHWLEVVGSELDVAVQGQLKVEGEEDDDEDEKDGKNDEDDEDEDEDEEDDEDEDEDGEEDEDDEAGADESQPLVPAEPEPDHNLWLEVTAANVNLAGVEGAQIIASGSYVHIGRTRGPLTLTLEGGTAEIQEHQGILVLAGTEAELTLTDVQGQVEPAISGGSLLVRGGFGKLAGRADDALVSLDGWRGPVTVEGDGTTVQARALRGVRLQLKGQGLEVGLEDVQGYLLAELTGGSLSAGEFQGQAQITALAGAMITVETMRGNPILTVTNGSARFTDVDGLLRANVSDGRLEVDGARQFELIAARAEVTAGRISRLHKIEITDSQLDLDLTEILHPPDLTLKGSTEARVRLRTPCSVKLGEAQLLNGQADVSGCELHSQTLRRTRYERQGLDGQRRMTLKASMGEDSTLEVEGVP